MLVPETDKAPTLPLPARASDELLQESNVGKVARLESLNPGEMRGSARVKLRLSTSLPERGEPATIHDLSATGVLIESATQLAPFDELLVELPHAGSIAATVIWASGRFMGCQFHETISKAALSAALLRNDYKQGHPELITVDHDHEDETEVEWEDERFSLTIRLRVILGSSIVLWALILWLIRIV
jgi:hypothetical protein